MEGGNDAARTRPIAVFIAFGTKGDVYPIAAIAAAFSTDLNGYDVAFITHSAHENLSSHLAKRDVTYVPVSSPPVLSSNGTDDNTGSPELEFLEQKKIITKEHRRECYSAVERLLGDDPCLEGDFIGINFFALEGWSLAELFSVRCIVLAPYVVPYSAPSFFERHFRKELPLLYKYFQEAPADKVCWKDVIHWMWPLFSENWASWRSEDLNLSPYPFTDPVTDLPTWHDRPPSPLLLYGFSKEIVECPDYWPSNTRVCGFWFVPKEWQFSCLECGQISTLLSSGYLTTDDLCPAHADLQYFLKNPLSRPPIFIGLSSIGSMGFMRNPRAFLDVVRTVLEVTCHRFILFTDGYEPLDAAVQEIAYEASSISNQRWSVLKGISLFDSRLFCFSGKRIVGTARSLIDASKLITEEKAKPKERAELPRSIRDDRSYKDALLTSSKKRRDLDNRENINDSSERGKGKKNIWDMHIPTESSSWVKRSLTGFEVKIVSWGYVWNSCVVTFKSDEEMKEAWMNKSEVLWFWFDWLAPLLNELGGGESTKNRERSYDGEYFDKVASPFEVPEVITLGSYGRSFKLKIKLSSTSSFSNFFPSISPEKDSDGRDTAIEPSEEEVDSLNSPDKVGSVRLVEDARKKVDMWINQGVSSGFVEVGRGNQFPRSSSDGKSINEGVLNLHSFGSSKMGEYAGLGIRNLDISNFSIQAQSVGSSEPVSPIKKIIPASSTVKINGLGFGSQNQYPTSSSSSGEGGFNVTRIRGDLQNRSSSLSMKSTPDGRRMIGSYKRVYRRSRERNIWLQNVQGFSTVTEGDLSKQKEKAIISRSAQSEIPEVVHFIEGDSDGSRNRRFSSRFKRSMIMDALDQVVESIKECKKVHRRAGILSIIRSTKSAMKKWSGRRNQFPGALVTALEEKIHQLEKNFQQQQFSRGRDSVAELCSLRNELWRLYKIEEHIWFQSSREKWGEIIYDPFLIKASVRDHFFEAFNDRSTLEMDDIKLNFSRISLEQSLILEKELTEEEIWEILNSCDGNKTPGPDGLNMGFFKSASQFAFIPGRQILDCSFIANEGIDFWRKKGLKGCVFKVDFRKTYDTVDWDILFKVMVKMGFRIKWCRWIRKMYYIRLGVSFGELLNLLLLKAISLGLLCGMVLGWSWHVQLRRNLCDWELDQFSDLLAIIHNITLSQVSRDGLIWKGNGEGISSVNSCVKLCYYVSEVETFWMKNIWRGLVPPRVETFMWQVVHQKLAVKSELQKRGVLEIVDCACPFCKREIESPSHLFFTCSVVWSLWNKFLNFWEVSSVFHDNTQSFLLAWDDLVSYSSIWSFIPGVVLWTIWKVRNVIVFEGGLLDQIDLFFMARFTLASWFLAKFRDVSISKDSFISDPSVADLCSSSRNSILNIVPWFPPPKGFLKLNVDANVCGDWRKSGIGGLLRDEDDIVMGSFQDATGPGPPLMELKAIKKGLIFFDSLRHQFKNRLIVETDSKLAMEWDKNLDRCPFVYVDLVKDIAATLRDMEGVIRLVARTYNIEVDGLAKAGIG
ncbi:XS domain-containing / XS zinc finger domain-containing protein-related-like protein isoform 1 [Hibiscus syriacus]|uniref:XS domain-containing / XS zinc finger domain-containing protein-related-like protein isoform 1 n=1 Tax=Hibiscus syriacus TaxID=106335 RepID=A0A6A2XT23_HIBSY|nr:XS domain-containing / XS zinc finger domain-containing protein-related-like protein isoform 1 [Hibiscus syriacus]